VEGSLQFFKTRQKGEKDKLISGSRSSKVSDEYISESELESKRAALLAQLKEQMD
jgi:hypothetical protein